jgi:hypothetical protein
MPIKADGVELMSADAVQQAALNFVRHGIGDVVTSSEINA